MYDFQYMRKQILLYFISNIFFHTYTLYIELKLKKKIYKSRVSQKYKWFGHEIIEGKDCSSV